MRKNFFYYLSPSVLTGIVGLFVIIPVSTYYLNPEDFGIVGIITVFSGLIVPLSSTGVFWVLAGNYYKVSPEERKELISTIIIFGILLRAFWVLVIGISGFWFLPLWVSSYQGEFLLFLWLFLIAEWFNSVGEIVSYVIVLQKKGQAYAAYEIIQIVSRLSVLLIALLVFDLKTISLVLMYLGAAFGGFLFSVFYIRKYSIFSIKIKWIKEIIKRGLPTIPVNILEIIPNSLGRLFIERWSGLASLGIYSHSLYYRRMFLMVFKAFSNSYSPEIVEAASVGDRQKMIKMKEIFNNWTGFLGIAGVAVCLFSPEVIGILTHGKFISAAPIVSLWFILIMVYFFGVPYLQYLLAKKKNKIVFFSEVIPGLLFCGLTILFVRVFGMVGAAISIILYFFSTRLVRRIYAIKLGCISFERISFWVSLVVLIGLITFKIYLLPFSFKCAIFTGLAIIAFWCFDLKGIIRGALKKHYR